MGLTDATPSIARSINPLRGRWESFWAPGSYSAVTLVSPDDMLAKIAYVLANPVAAGLVQHGREWPGLWSAPEQIGAGPVLVKRPDHFFRKDGSMPQTVPLELVCPPGFESVDAFRQQLISALTKLEDEAARALQKEGRSFMWTRPPTSWPTRLPHGWSLLATSGLGSGLIRS